MGFRVSGFTVSGLGSVFMEGVRHNRVQCVLEMQFRSAAGCLAGLVDENEVWDFGIIAYTDNSEIVNNEIHYIRDYHTEAAVLHRGWFAECSRV